jgi:hypothetical protein
VDDELVRIGDDSRDNPANRLEEVWGTHHGPFGNEDLLTFGARPGADGEV